MKTQIRSVMKKTDTGPMHTYSGLVRIKTVIHCTEWRWLVHEKAQQESLFTIYRYFSNFLYKRSTPRSFCNTNCENTCYPSLYRTLDSPLIILINGINSFTDCADRKVRYSYWIFAHRSEWKSVKSVLAMFSYSLMYAHIAGNLTSPKYLPYSEVKFT